MSKKSRKYKKKQQLELNTRADEIFILMGMGKTLQEVSDDLDEKYSDFISEIADHPKLKKAVSDGKEKGKSHWQKKLKKAMFKRDCHPSLIKFWFSNYMQWYDKPMPEEFSENAEVFILVTKHKPKRKQQALIDKYTDK